MPRVVLLNRLICLRIRPFSCRFSRRIGVEKVPLSLPFASLSSCFRFSVWS